MTVVVVDEGGCLNHNELYVGADVHVEWKITVNKGYCNILRLISSRWIGGHNAYLNSLCKMWHGLHTVTVVCYCTTTT